MTKVDWLAAGVLLIPSSLDFSSVIKKGSTEFATFSSQWERARPAALTNNKQEKVDQTQAYNVIKIHL